MNIEKKKREKHAKTLNLTFNLRVIENSVCFYLASLTKTLPMKKTDFFTASLVGSIMGDLYAWFIAEDSLKLVGDDVNFLACTCLANDRLPEE